MQVAILEEKNQTIRALDLNVLPLHPTSPPRNRSGP
jgi:hypothetical protein